ncbi:MAG: hypothetical protein COB76_02215 [Alphaproteobacteria bacterium]|nr:MAG: hypothetical protein COB76_02215 [Alphaproteobacteria bacterium]
MNKYIIMILYIVISHPSASYGHQTNINEVTDLFDKHIEDKDELLHKMKAQNDNAISQIQSRSNHDLIEGSGSVETKTKELNSIRETDLDNAGRQARFSKEYQFYDENELEPDYTKSGNHMHKLDSDDIVSATDETMRKVGADFMAKLISEGFNCKTVKGAVQKEPTYYIEIKSDEQKNTEYKQFFCEEPRNKYNCNDSVSLTCMKKGPRYREWSEKEAIISGNDIYFQAQDLGYAVKWKRKRWGWHLHQNQPGWRIFLADYLQVHTEQIHDNIEFPHGARGIGKTYSIGERWRVVFDHYVIKYKFREVYEVCEEWAESWTERCGLQ